MWYSAEIVLKFYVPFKLEEGMLFVNRISVGIIEPYIALWKLDGDIPEDVEDFIATHGAPVELFIVDNQGAQDNVLANQEQIGWWDEGEHTDELRDITLDDINLILREWDGWLAIEMGDEDENGDAMPNLFEDRVILSFDQEENDEDWDVTTSEGLDDDEIELEEIKRIERDNN